MLRTANRGALSKQESARLRKGSGRFELASTYGPAAGAQIATAAALSSSQRVRVSARCSVPPRSHVHRTARSNAPNGRPLPRRCASACLLACPVCRPSSEIPHPAPCRSSPPAATLGPLDPLAVRRSQGHMRGGTKTDGLPKAKRDALRAYRSEGTRTTTDLLRRVERSLATQCDTAGPFLRPPAFGGSARGKAEADLGC
jgi:hypothetical protein